MSSAYVLEGEREFQRLEYQSSLPEYDCRRELGRVSAPPGARILDAGCGSGAVTRFLAERFPSAQIVGCDLSDLRVAQARKALKHLRSISIETQDLLRLSYPNDRYDVIVCRYVLQHMGAAGQQRALGELKRCLKPGGMIHVVDADGFIVNLHPAPPSVVETLKRLEGREEVDVRVGRKLQGMMRLAGFSQVDCSTEAVHFSEEALGRERELMRMRFAACGPLLAKIAGPGGPDAFVADYLAALVAPGATYFFNRMAVTGTKG